MQSFLGVPKVQLAITLILIYLTALKYNPSFSSIYILITALGFTIFFDLIFTFFKSKTLFLPLASVVTGLIIALLIDPNALWYQVAIICALAVASKVFLRFDNRHIFNPAAAGFFLGGVIFNIYITWWGTSFQNITPLNLAGFILFVVFLLPFLISGWRMKRYGSILSFLLVYIVFSGALNILFNPTIIFFALVMLPEPMTSPFKLNRQVLYGATVAALTLILSYAPVAAFLSNLRLLPDALVPALLLGNLLFFKYR